MTIFMEEEGQINLQLNYEPLCKQTIELCMDYLKCPYEAEVSVLITTDEEIRSINLEQRDIDKATDVLSFPMVEWETPCDYDALENSFECFHPESGELLLGDIILSADKVVSQAEEYGHSIQREFSFLIVHSMLHLFGHDHMVDDERILMEEMQAEIMNQLGIAR